MKAAINHPQAPTAQQWRRMIAITYRIEQTKLKGPDGQLGYPSRRFACEMAINAVKPDALPEVIDEVEKRINEREAAGVDF